MPYPKNADKKINKIIDKQARKLGLKIEYVKVGERIE
jgi:hypothetical protein